MSDKCDDCQHCFKPRMKCMGIREFRGLVRVCTSQSIWVVHNGHRYRLSSLGKVNFSWSGWCYDRESDAITLSDMHKAFDDRENWSGLNNYSLDIHIMPTDTWVSVFRIEEKIAFPPVEEDRDIDELEGEILIHVHNEDDVLRAYEER